MMADDIKDSSLPPVSSVSHKILEGEDLNGACAPIATDLHTRRLKRTDINDKEVMNSCIAHGCTNILHKPYHRRYRICAEHLLSPSINVNGSHFRYCQQCSLLHNVSCFNAEQRSCTDSLGRMRIRRSAQKQTTAAHSRTTKRKRQPSDKASRKNGNPDLLNYNNSNNEDEDDDNDNDHNDNGRLKKNRGPYKQRRNTKQQQQQHASSPPQYINMEGHHPRAAAAASFNGQLQQQYYGYDPSSHHHHHQHHHHYIPPPVRPIISLRANSNDAIKPSARRGPMPSELILAPPASMAFSIPAATIPWDQHQQHQHLMYQQLAHADDDNDGVDANKSNTDAIENPFANNHIKETISEVWTELPQRRSSTHSRSSLETLRKSRELSNPLLWTLSGAPMKSLILSGVTNNNNNGGKSLPPWM